MPEIGTRVACLSAFGLLAVPYWLVRLTRTQWDKTADWLMFELVGIALISIPVIVLADRRLKGAVNVILGGVGVAGLAFFFWKHQGPVVWAGAATSLVFYGGRKGRLQSFLVALVFWTAAVTIVSIPGGSFEAVALRTPTLFLPVVLVVQWLVATSLFGRHRAAMPRRWDLLALVPIALACCRSDYLFDSMAVHHWSAYLGSAEVVRRGGWLLWDTPAQYGFLTTLTVAMVPFRDLWQGFYALNVCFLVVSCLLLFLAFRSWGGPGSYLLALVATLAFEIWLPGWGGALVTPSAGAIRFLWCQLLLWMLWVHHVRQRDSSIYAGTAFWVIGSLWSAESMFYCSLTWLPAFACLWWRGKTSVRLWTPPALLAVAAACVAAYYLLVLGNLPDVWSFFEYVFAFRRFYTMSIGPNGPVWMLLLILALAATALLFEGSCLVVGLVGCTWAVGSYFIGNCNDISATNLLTILSMVIALLGYVAREQPKALWSFVIRLGLAALVVSAVSMDVLAGRWVNRGTLQPSSYFLDISTRRPRMNEQLLSALEPARGQPMVFQQIEDPGSGLDWRPWLPFGSLVALMPIPEPRQDVYFERYLARHPAETGWLIETQGGPKSNEIRVFIDRHYAPTDIIEIGTWKLTQYQSRR